MKRSVLLMSSCLLLAAQPVLAADMQPAASPEKAMATDAPKAEKSAAPKKKMLGPETAKDRENKKKCRSLGGTWQLGHCNVG